MSKITQRVPHYATVSYWEAVQNNYLCPYNKKNQSDINEEENNAGLWHKTRSH